MSKLDAFIDESIETAGINPTKDKPLSIPVKCPNCGYATLAFHFNNMTDVYDVKEFKLIVPDYGPERICLSVTLSEEPAETECFGDSEPMLVCPVCHYETTQVSEIDYEYTEANTRFEKKMNEILAKFDLDQIPNEIKQKIIDKLEASKL